MGWVQAGMLGALAALAVPIIVHLVYGRRARRIDLGTLRFLLIALRENIRRRRLKRWMLLALRMLCVALLAVLFARPYPAARPSGSRRRPAKKQKPSTGPLNSTPSTASSNATPATP